MKRLIYYIQYPEMVQASPNEPPMVLFGKGATAPVINCPKPDGVDRQSLDGCFDCDEYESVDASGHFVNCKHVQSQQEKDEKDRRRRGISTQTKKPLTPVVGPEPGVPAPKNVFVVPQK